MHYCSQQWSYVAKPLAEYTVDIRRECRTGKECAPRRTVACVQQVAYIDNWRRAQDLTQQGPDALVKLE